jgi:cysteine desulfurase
MNIDLMSVSGHKIYSPKGIGALYVRRKPRVRLSPIISGGGQERGMRSGTLPVPLIVGLGKAAEIAQAEMEKDRLHITRLHNLFMDTLFKNITDIYLNGDKEQRIHGNINLSFAYIEGESMLMALKNLAVSSGSACTSASLEPSYVLKSIGVTEDLAHTSIRFGIGRFTTESEIKIAIDLIKTSVIKLKKMSPLWDMAQEGIDINAIEWAEH